MLGAVHFNADDVRKSVYRDSGFTRENAVEHARRMGRYCDSVTVAGRFAIADFICPTPEARQAFGPAFVVWVDRIQGRRYADANQLFVPPENYDVRVLPGGSPLLWAMHIYKRLKQYRNAGFPDADLLCPFAGRTRDLLVPAQRASVHAEFSDHAGASERSR